MLALALQALPASLGVSKSAHSARSVLFVLIPVAAQLIFFWLGYLLGNRFIYLMEEFKAVVIFIGFFIIGVRFVVSAFTVRKGKMTFQTENITQNLLVSIAQSTNTFLVGLLFCFFDFNLFQTLGFLGLFTLIISLSGMFSKLSKKSLALSSLLILLCGLFIMGSALYLAFLK